MLDFELSTVVFTIVNLLVLYFLLKKFLFQRVNRILEERAALVKQTIDDAQAKKDQADALCKEYEENLAQAHTQAAEILDQAKARGERIYNQYLDQAKAEAKTVREQARIQGKEEREAMLRSARGEVARLAVLAAAQVAQRSLDQEADREIAAQFLSEVGEQK